jgi:hypothetical protein
VTERDDKGRFTARPKTMGEWFKEQFVLATGMGRLATTESRVPQERTTGSDRDESLPTEGTGLDQGARGGMPPRKPTMSDFVMKLFQENMDRKGW